MTDPLANLFKSFPESKLERLANAIPSSLAGVLPTLATLAAQLSDGTALSTAGAGAMLLGALLSVTTARGGQRLLSEAALLQEGLADLEQKALLRTDLQEEWFRQLVRDFLKEAAREEDELHREQLRHVLLHGSMRESPNGRASIYFEIARRLQGRDIALLKACSETSELYEREYKAGTHDDVGKLKEELLAKLESRDGFGDSWVLLVRESLKEGPSGSSVVVSAGPENHPFHVTHSGLQLLEWVSWPPVHRDFKS